MSERDALIRALRDCTSSDYDAPAREDAASLLERDGAELARLRAEVARLTVEAARHETEMGAMIDERDEMETALSSAHTALGEDGEWACRIPSPPPPDSGNLCLDVPALAERVATENAALLARVEAWERASQEGHPAPCTLGPLCPYCEIDRLRARAEAAEKAIERVLPAKAREHIDCWKVNYGLDRYDKVTAARRWAEAGGPSDGPIMALATAIEWLEST